MANTTTPSVASVSPTNGATAVAVNSTVVLTFNEAIDASTVNNTTVPISVAGVTGVLAGSYAVDATGTVVTFTPRLRCRGRHDLRPDVLRAGARPVRKPEQLILQFVYDCGHR